MFRTVSRLMVALAIVCCLTVSVFGQRGGRGGRGGFGGFGGFGGGGPLGVLQRDDVQKELELTDAQKT